MSKAPRLRRPGPSMTATVTATSDTAEPLAECRPVRCLALDFGGTIGLRELDHLIGQRPVDPAAVEPLRLLHKRRRRLLLASNTLPCETRWPALQQAGVDDLFTCSLLSHSLGVAKPARIFYSLVIAAAECEPGEILFVGDSIRSDVVGPMKAGMRAALIRPCGMRPGENLPAGAIQIRHIADLIDLPGLW
ncbi:MAG: HAD hydrolase-like protein [Streptosporangiales bacterium]|nr:HAD hydrolase-like protein [Streptosporangiales bacterium]